MLNKKIDSIFSADVAVNEKVEEKGNVLLIRASRVNLFSKERVYSQLNELTFDICINKEDLFGEPEVGRRFKGFIWMQGYINFPEE